MKLLFRALLSAATLVAVFAIQGGAFAGAAGDIATGKNLFKSKGCGNCHTLTNANAKGKAARNLDQNTESASEIAAAIMNQAGGMPSFGLSEQEANEIGDYTVAAAKWSKAIKKCKKLKGKKKKKCTTKANKLLK